jgi:hypothetical protein
MIWCGFRGACVCGVFLGGGFGVDLGGLVCVAREGALVVVVKGRRGGVGCGDGCRGLGLGGGG